MGRDRGPARSEVTIWLLLPAGVLLVNFIQVQPRTDPMPGACDRLGIFIDSNQSFSTDSLHFVFGDIHRHSTMTSHQFTKFA